MDDDVASLAREGRFKEAAEIASARGDAKSASDLFERACEWSRAAREALHMGDVTNALRLSSLGGDEGLAWYAVELLDPRGAETAARALAAHGDAKSAARAFEIANLPREAAREWVKVDEVECAADLLVSAGDVAGAARMLEATLRRDPSRARAGIALGKVLLAHGKPEAAVRALQRVNGTSLEKRRALTFLTRALDVLGLHHARDEANLELDTLGGPSRDLEPVAAPLDDTSAIPRLFGRYDVVRDVASSSTARVVECIDRVRGDRVAVKILAAHAAPGAGRDALARFEREVKSMRSLAHPNVVPLRDFIEAGPAIVTSWMAGGSLASLIARGPIAPKRAVEIACAILSALAEAHRVGILHRDVKPDNVLLDDAGTPRLADFGVAHLADAATTATAAVLGTRAYMSPEQREGRPATPASDVYSTGIVLLEMLAGGHARASRRPSTLSSGLDARHDDAIARLVAEDASARIDDALEASVLLASLPWPATVDLAASPPSLRAASDHPAATRADFSTDGSGFNRWLARAFVHVPLDDASLLRARAFARADHPVLQTILRVDRDTRTLWLEPARGRPLDAPLTSAQRASLASALASLHAAGLAHGSVDRAHIVVGDLGAPTLLFAVIERADCAPDTDISALARLSD